MQRIVIGSEALASGRLTRRDLRTRYVKLHRNIYAAAGVELTALDRAVAAWLWSRGEAILVGTSAAAVLGTRWLPGDSPAELGRMRHHAPGGIVIRADVIADDERQVARGMTCTTPARTAFDLGRRLTGETAVLRIDALMNATKVPVSQVISMAARHPGARGMRQLRATLELADGGAESPQETRLQHFTNPDDYANDIERLEFLADKGWNIVRVSARQLRYERRQILHRVRKALARSAT